MSAAAILTSGTIVSEPVYRLSVAQYHAALRAGVFDAGDAVELLEGILVVKMPKNPTHVAALARLLRAITALVPDGFSVRAQDPITLGDGEPEPDLVVVRGGIEDYVARHPGPEDIALVVEVSDTTLDRDRGIKRRSYARASLPEYWIVNLVDRCVEVHAAPDPRASTPTYRTQATRGIDEEVPLTLGGVLRGSVRVADVIV